MYMRIIIILYVLYKFSSSSVKFFRKKRKKKTVEKNYVELLAGWPKYMCAFVCMNADVGFCGSRTRVRKRSNCEKIAIIRSSFSQKERRARSTNIPSYIGSLSVIFHHHYYYHNIALKFQIYTLIGSVENNCIGQQRRGRMKKKRSIFN